MASRSSAVIARLTGGPKIEFINGKLMRIFGASRLVMATTENVSFPGAPTGTAPVSTGRRCGGPAMRWQMGRRSDNIEDRRGMPVGRGAAVGGGIGTLLLVLLAMYFGVDPSVILGTDPGSSRPSSSVQQ